MRNTVEDKDKLAEKLSTDDKDSILEAIEKAETWLAEAAEEWESMSKEDFEEQMREMQAVCDPIIAQIYNSQGYQNGGQADDDEEFEDL